MSLPEANGTRIYLDDLGTVFPDASMETLSGISELQFEELDGLRRYSPEIVHGLGEIATLGAEIVWCTTRTKADLKSVGVIDGRFKHLRHLEIVGPPGKAIIEVKRLAIEADLERLGKKPFIWADNAIDADEKVKQGERKPVLGERNRDNINTVFTGIRSLLISPNPEIGLEPEALRNMAAFIKIHGKS